MPLSSIDFGNGIVPITGTDAFFLDTNMLVAYFYEKHEKHIPCYCLISYLIKKEVVICISEIVLVELINSLARVLYIDERFTQYVKDNGEPDNKRKLERVFQGDWSNKVIKSEPETLKKFNALAVSKIEPFIKGVLVIECSEGIIEEVVSITQNTPLASADAMIVATALNFGCAYIFSIDGDMAVADEIEVITTSKRNVDYDVQNMLDQLKIKQYLFEKLGEDDFKNKFPTVVIPVT